MHKALYPRNDIDRLHVSREDGRGLASIQDSVDASMQQLEDYIQKTEEGWIQWPETIQTTQASTEQKLPENKNLMKNKCMDISSKKQTK